MNTETATEETPEVNMAHSTPKTLNIIYGPHSALRLKSLPVDEEDFGESLNNIANLMLNTMRAYNGAGLAGIQVGIQARIFVANAGGSDLVMVNPVYADKSEEMIGSQEGCLSLPLYRFGETRHKSVTVKFQDPFGNSLEETFFDEESAMIQHEMEHLDGITLLSKLSRLKQDIYKRKFRKLKKKLNRNRKTR
jgi:peptide deformylase